MFSRDRYLAGAVDEIDAFLDGAFEFDPAGRNFLGRAPVDHLDILAAGQALGHPAGVHGDIAAADHRHGLGHLGPRPGVDLAQVLDAVDDPLVVLAGNFHALAPPRADGQQHGVVAILELVEGDIAAQR